MRFSDVTDIMPSGMADALRLTPTQEYQAEQHWRSQFAAALRSNDVREWLTRVLGRLLPFHVRIFVKVRKTVNRVCDALAAWVEPGGPDSDLIDETTGEAVL